MTTRLSTDIAYDTEHFLWSIGDTRAALVSTPQLQKAIDDLREAVKDFRDSQSE